MGRARPGNLDKGAEGRCPLEEAISYYIALTLAANIMWTLPMDFDAKFTAASYTDASVVLRAGICVLLSASIAARMITYGAAACVSWTSEPKLVSLIREWSIALAIDI